MPGACVFSLVMFSFVLNAIQFAVHPLDWVGLQWFR